MFEKGNLLLFRPFVFKNGAMPKDKFFLVLENVDGNLLLASLPTSKDHVPSDVEVKHGCLDLAERFVNVFVFLSGEEILCRAMVNVFLSRRILSYMGRTWICITFLSLNYKNGYLRQILS